MKDLFKIMFLAVLSMMMVACGGDDDEVIEPSLDVTPHNIAGQWCVESWNGSPLAEGSFVYIEFERADRQFTMYQNLDSAQARTLTGHYYIENAADNGAIIRGNYDHGVGEWAHRYYVRNLTAESMTWIAKDNADDVTVYVRCEIPAELAGE
ncbi:MAG: lipocalin family protein [Alistipes sp.]|jgi:hypothetical protein|nr:lipocalin family protein [Alistipes sp.]